MGSYPLPALAVQPPQSPLEQYGKVASLADLAQRRQLLQGQAQLQQGDIQLQQQKIQDQNAMTAAIKQWDGGDMHALPDLVKKNGGSANAVLGLQSNLLEYDKGLAQKTEADLKNEATKNDMIAGHIDTIKGLPPEQQPQAFSSAVQDLAKRGYLDPQSASNLKYPGPDGLDALEKIYQSHASQVSDKLKESEGQANQAKLIEANLKIKEFAAHQPGGTLYQPTVEAEAALLKAPIELQTAIAKETDPRVQAGKVAVATAEGQARANVEAQVARGSNAALANVPPHLVAPATAEATKLGTDYANFSGQMENLKSQLAAAKTGDQVASAFAPVATALGSNAFYGTHRLAPSEVLALGPQLGSTAREINTWFDKHATGTLPPDSIKEFNALVDRLTSAKSNSYNNGLKVLNQNYGSNFKPLEPSSGGGAQPATGKTLSQSAIQKAAKDHGVSVEEATRQAKAAGYAIGP